MKNLLNRSIIESFQKESKDAMSLFENIITRLGSLNDRIQASKAERIAKIDKYQSKIDEQQSEINALVEIETKNDKLSFRLLTFLEN